MNTNQSKCKSRQQQIAVGFFKIKQIVCLLAKRTNRK